MLVRWPECCRAGPPLLYILSKASPSAGDLGPFYLSSLPKNWSRQGVGTGDGKWNRVLVEVASSWPLNSKILSRKFTIIIKFHFCM